MPNCVSFYAQNQPSSNPRKPFCSRLGIWTQNDLGPKVEQFMSISELANLD
jgi:hypothetical protein